MGGSDSGVGVKAGVDSFFDQLESESELESTFFDGTGVGVRTYHATGQFWPDNQIENPSDYRF